MGNTYTGLYQGQPMIFDDSNIEFADPGSIDGATVDGQSYQGTSQVGGNILGSKLGTGLDIAKVGLGAANTFLAYQNYGLAKDQFAFNKMNSNRNYEANRTKYNNAAGRTNAVNRKYGLGDSAKLV